MAAILMTFDIEEFDTAIEYGNEISFSEQLEISKHGLESILSVLENEHLPCTLFTTAAFAQTFPDLIRRSSSAHEIASHGLTHNAVSEADLLPSKKILEDITGTKVNGFRAPRMKQLPELKIAEAGYHYHSSSHPTWLPSKYNYMKQPAVPHFRNNIYVVPASVSPILHIPLFWLSFKNFPFWLYKKLCESVIRKNKVLCLYFHPWEFVALDEFRIPFFIKRYSGLVLIERLILLIHFLKERGLFQTMNEFTKTSAALLI